MLHARKNLDSVAPRAGQGAGKKDGWWESRLIASVRFAKGNAATQGKRDAWQYLTQTTVDRGLGERSPDDPSVPPTLFRRPPPQRGDACVTGFGGADTPA